MVNHIDGNAFEGFPGWSISDSLAAQVEGWLIIEVVNTSDPVGPFMLCKSDSLEIFANDQEAWEHVLAKATPADGEAFYKRAIEFLRQHSPIEFQTISDNSDEQIEAVVTGHE